MNKLDIERGKMECVESNVGAGSTHATKAPCATFAPDTAKHLALVYRAT